jgi:hypothetical protein
LLRGLAFYLIIRKTNVHRCWESARLIIPQHVPEIRTSIVSLACSVHAGVWVEKPQRLQTGSMGKEPEEK